MESMTRLGVLRNHIEWASEQDFCGQCVEPWNDGICDCGNHDNERVAFALEVAFELERRGQDLNKV